MATPDGRRREEIEELIDLIGLEDDQKILRAIPLESDDPEDKEFEIFYAYVQLIQLISSADDEQKCDILKDIVMLNKRFNIQLDALDYYIQLCRG